MKASSAFAIRREAFWEFSKENCPEKEPQTISAVEPFNVKASTANTNFDCIAALATSSLGPVYAIASN
jgi:hypothetical protein